MFKKWLILPLLTAMLSGCTEVVEFVMDASDPSNPVTTYEDFQAGNWGPDYRKAQEDARRERNRPKPMTPTALAVMDANRTIDQITIDTNGD